MLLNYSRLVHVVHSVCTWKHIMRVYYTCVPLSYGKEGGGLMWVFKKGKVAIILRERVYYWLYAAEFCSRRKTMRLAIV